MAQQSYSVGDQIHGFSFTRIEEIKELRSTAQMCEHDKTGARLLHLKNDDPNNLFCIGFRTPVFDNTGVPHILEHSVLGGSKKFPVKDPFQALLKASLQTFLNAMTYPDKTIYPVSSQVEKDFFNLVDVYCDAVFHPLLTENTLFQEGWHFDLEKPDGEVNIKGIVYNEMKGVFSDFSSHVVRKTMSALYPDTTYFFESGGEPEHITELTYERFKKFHRTFYHPSNSYIFLYGNLPLEKSLAFLHDNYLNEFDKIEPESSITPQPLWDSPRRVSIEAPCSEEDDKLSTVIVSWIFGDSTNPVDALNGSILSRYLMGTQSSPLRRALVDSELGEDLDDISGFDAELIQGFFAIGLRKTKAEHADKIYDIVMNTLKKEVEQGLDPELLEGSLRRTEFALRELSGHARFPYNLRLADRCLQSWIYDGDPLSHLAFEKPLTAIKDAFKNDPSYFSQIIKEKLLENTHHLTSIVTGSQELGKKLEQQTEEQSKTLSANFTDTDRQKHYEITQKLLEQQKKPASPEALATIPSLEKSDLPLKNQSVPIETEQLERTDLFMHPLFTSGVSYFDIGFECSGIPTDLIYYLPLYADILCRCGANGYSYEQMAKRISLASGGISTSIMADETADNPSQLVFKCFFHGKSLTDRFDEMLNIFRDLFFSPQLDNNKLLKDILVEMRNDLHSSIIHSGHSFASMHAASRLNSTRQLCEILDGIDQLRFLDKLVKTNNIGAISAKMHELHELIIADNSTIVSLTADNPFAHKNSVESLVKELPASSQTSALQLNFTNDHPAMGIEISSSVNFVSKAWLLPWQDEENTASLNLLSQNLSRGYLWDKIRVEGGAYGAFCSYGGTSPALSCASYRDPNITATLSAFEKSFAAVAKELDEATLNQNIIGTIGQIDKPRAPHSRAFGETCAHVLHKPPERRQKIRDAILQAKPEHIKAKAEEILDTKENAITILGSTTAFDTVAKEDLVITRQKLLQ